MEFTFTLRFQLSSSDDNPGSLTERLGTAGCTDALIGSGRPGRLALEFCRDAPSARIAVRTALANAQGAIPSARLIEAAPDFVGLTDIAEMIGVSRQNMRKLMLSSARSFPSPVHEGTTCIWHLADVLDWLGARGGYAIEQRLQEVASVTLELNLALRIQRLSAKARAGLDALIDSGTDQLLMSNSSAS